MVPLVLVLKRCYGDVIFGPSLLGICICFFPVLIKSIDNIHTFPSLDQALEQGLWGKQAPNHYVTKISKPYIVISTCSCIKYKVLVTLMTSFKVPLKDMFSTDDVKTE